MLNSVWADFEGLPKFPALEGDLRTDVLVIGGGMAGLLCVKKLEEAGMDCALIESDRIMHGVSRNTTAKITSQHGFVYDRLLRQFDGDVARCYWQANEQAIGEYFRLARDIRCDLERKDNYIYASDAPEKLERELAALQRLGIPAEQAHCLPIPVEQTGAIRFRDQAQFHPLKFAAGIAAGQRIFEGTAAREFVGNTVVTDRGRIRAEKIIVATHFPMLNKHGGYFLKLYQERSYVLALEQGGQVDGMYLGDGEQGLSFRNQGELLLLGGGSHRTGKQGRGWASLEEFARRHYPSSRITHRWATQDCMTLDGIPYIGRYSRKKAELYVATGFNKWGMTSSMAAASILADLVQGKPNKYAHIFDPSRSVWRVQLAVNAGESAMNLIKPTRPRCPHLGCALKWNPQERSWDCPCHGSRFSQDGRLLDNPATGDLNVENQPNDR